MTVRNQYMKECFKVAMRNGCNVKPVIVCRSKVCCAYVCKGYPNVGKSSLINGLMGKKVSVFDMIVILTAACVMYKC